NNFADHIEELGEIAVAVLVAGPDFGGEMRVTFAVRGKIMSRTGRADAEGHVRVLRVGDDERARGGIRFDLGEFGVEGLHACTLASVSWSALAEFWSASFSLG